MSVYQDQRGITYTVASQDAVDHFDATTAASIEVENTLYRHPAVLEAAVVARSDEKWGETPCAFVTLKDDAPEISAEDIIAFCRDHLAHFKVPPGFLR